MELDLRLLQAVITHHCHVCVSVLKWHLVFRQLLVVVRRVVSNVHQRLLADGARYIGFLVLSHALEVHAVPTLDDHARKDRVVHIRQTNGAVHLEPAFFANVRVLHRYVVAASARVTVELRLTPADPADATLVAVVNLLLVSVVVVKGTDLAVIGGEVLLAIGTSASFGLFMLAAETLNIVYFVAVELMVGLWVQY